MVLILFNASKGFSFSEEKWAYYFDAPHNILANAIDITSDGGYIIAGEIYTSIKGSFDFFVIKLNSKGSFEWQKQYGGYGGSKQERASSIRQTNDGGYIVAGKVTDFYGGNADAWIIKLDYYGNIEWQKIYEGKEDDHVYAIVQTGDGGYIASGCTRNYGSYQDAWIIKLDSMGNIQWEKTYGGESTESAFDIIQSSHGDYIVAGQTKFSGQAWPDAWVFKLNSAGDILWQKAYRGAGTDYIHSIKETPGGEYVIRGSTQSFGAGSTDIWLLKLDADGNVIWQKTYGTADQDEGWPFDVTKDGGIIIAGSINGMNNGDMVAIKLDSNGNIVWQRAFDYEGMRNWFSGVLQTDDGGYVFSGMWQNLDIRRIMVLKTDSNGQIDSSCGYDANLVSFTSNATAVTTATIPQPLPEIAYDTYYQGINTDIPEIHICGNISCIKPTGIQNNIASDPNACVEDGILISWQADAGYWGDGNQGDRTYDVLRNNLPLASGLAYGTTNFLDTSGTTCSYYLYSVRYNNGCGLSTATEGAWANDGGHSPCGLINNIASDLDACSDTGIYINWALEALDWGDGDSGIRTYEVLRNEVPIATGLIYGNFNYIDTNGAIGINYTYTVRYNNGCGFFSETTPGAEATDNIDLEPCPSVGNNVLVSKSGNNVLLTWTNIDCTDFANYRIFGGQSFSDPFPSDWDILGNPATTSFNDSLDSYYLIYKILSIDACGNLSAN